MSSGVTLPSSIPTPVTPASRLLPSSIPTPLSSAPPSSGQRGGGPRLLQSNVTLIPYSQLTVGARLAGGSFKDVFEGTWLGTRVAIGKLKMARLPARELEEFKREVQMLSTLSHPNIVQLMGACTDPLAIVTPLCPRGSLWNLLHKQRVSISMQDKIYMLRDLAQGLAFLHGSKVLHRDLKSANVLVTGRRDINLKICDFGLSKLLQQSTSQNSVATVGTYNWMAPEVIKSDAKYSYPADIYSLGMIGYEIFTGHIPYADLRDPVQFAYHVVVEKKRPSFRGSDLPAGVQHLIERCWHADPTQRPSIEEVVKVADSLLAQISDA